MRSSVSDMQKFLAANISLKSSTLKNALDYTHNPRILLTANSSKDIEIAMGWQIRKLNQSEIKMVWQGGQTEGFSSFLGFEEHSKTGVVILSNSNASVESLGFELLGKLLNDN